MICFLILHLDIREYLFVILNVIDFDERYIFKPVDYDED